MTTEKLVSDDFERAYFKAFWRKIISRLTGQNNDLLPFDLVREHLPFKGQRYLGLRVVPIRAIVGSIGRFHDFDRAFLPVQARTKGRWTSIDRAHYEKIHLPPVELIKMGEVYFVKDGNHRVSVAREWGQEFVDAYVIEIDVPVPLTADIQVDDLVLKREYAQFLEQTGLDKQRPEAAFDTKVPGQYEKLLEHIAFHRWVLGEKRQGEVTLEDAAVSWYDTVYAPLVLAIREQALVTEFPSATETDLYIWVIKYQWFLRSAYREESLSNEDALRSARKEAARQLIEEEKAKPLVRKLAIVLQKATWFDSLMLQQERADFLEQTKLHQSRPDAQIVITVPGGYEKLLEHIAVHRWYLGENRQAEVSKEEAALSWYDQVYLPIIKIVREQGVLDGFPERTEADLYLWLLEKRADLQDIYGEDVPLDRAARELIGKKKAARAS